MSRRNIKQEAQDAIAKGIVETEWEYIYGTKHQGNLPGNRKVISAITDDVVWVGYSWAPCPYSTSASDERREHLIGETDPSEGKNEHADANGKIYYMKIKGSGWGFECTFDDCPYKNTHGKPFSYVKANFHN